MSDFMDFKIEDVKENIVSVRAWFWSDAYYIQNTNDWLFASLCIDNKKFSVLADEENFKLELIDDPEQEVPDEFYGYTVDETAEQLSWRIIKTMHITDVRNLTPPKSFFTGEANLDERPSALYLVEFHDSKFAQSLEIGFKWSGPYFDLVSPTWLLSKQNEYLEIKLNNVYGRDENGASKITQQLKWFQYTKEGSIPFYDYASETETITENITTYNESLLFIDKKIKEGWVFVYCNHCGDKKELEFIETNNM